MLSELERDGLNHVVSWQPHGRCFLVHNQEQFVKEFLPLWFRQSRYASFQRQLNLYGFKRISAGRDKGAYYHEKFLRSKRFLANQIERLKIKGTGARKPSNPQAEPNFYMRPFLPPTPLEETKPKNSPAPVAAEAAPSQPHKAGSVPMPQPQPALNTLAALARAGGNPFAGEENPLAALACPGGAPMAGASNRAESIQRLCLASVLPLQRPEPPSQHAAGINSSFLSPLASTALLLEAHRAQLASQLMMQQVQKQQSDAASLERLAVMLGQAPARGAPVGPSSSNPPSSLGAVAAFLQQSRHQRQGQLQEEPKTAGNMNSSFPL